MSSEPRYASHSGDRRKHLHVPVPGVVTFAAPGGTLELPFTELSVGALFFAGDRPWEEGTELEVLSLRLEGQVFEVGAMARIAPPADGDPPGFVAELVDLDGPARASIQSAFSFALAKVTPKPVQPGQAMRFDWAFRDREQLARVCRALLAAVDLADAWTEAGPTAAATSALLDAHALPAEQAAMLEVAMKLWHGSLDLERHLGGFPPRVQGSLAALEKALTRGPVGVDEWLDVESR